MDDSAAEPLCPSCGQPRPDQFCGRCGEERVGPEDLRLRRFIGSAFAEFSNVDGTVLATVKKLILRPGELTNEYLAGRRRGYVRPFQLYILISIVFFVIMPHTAVFGYTYKLYQRPAMLWGASQRMINDQLARTHEPEASYEKRFNNRINGHKQILMLFLVPLFALGLVPLTRRRPYAAHVVFSVHFITLLLIWFLLFLGATLYVVVPLLRLFPPDMLRHGPHASGDEIIFIFVFLPLSIYLARSLQRVYGRGRIVNMLRAVALMAWLSLLIVEGYRNALFFSTFYSLNIFG